MFPIRLLLPIAGTLHKTINDGNFKRNIIVGGILSSYDNIPIDKSKNED
ncbi:MAG: hypothetical protein J7L22_01795 [Candidatus Marinimicrobia bacterium]|nr:hypothetical protein [Candidatus Neomarinimicrobiota bacterium]